MGAKYWFKKARFTSKTGKKTTMEMEKAWYKAGEDLPQTSIQAWIERIPRHVQEIIRLKG
jgi:hypothetical protein